MKVGDKVWFWGCSVLKTLGYKNTKDAIIKHVDAELKIKYSDIFGVVNHIPLVMDPQMVFISKPGVY